MCLCFGKEFRLQMKRPRLFRSKLDPTALVFHSDLLDVSMNRRSAASNTHKDMGIVCECCLICRLKWNI